jgi:hypothetical protein
MSLWVVADELALNMAQVNLLSASAADVRG